MKIKSMRKKISSSAFSEEYPFGADAINIDFQDGNNLEQSFSELKQKVSSNEGKISSLETRMTENESKVDSAVSNISNLTGRLSTVESGIENLETSKVNVSDIVDNLTSSDTDKPLSANMGKTIKESLDTISEVGWSGSYKDLENKPYVRFGEGVTIDVFLQTIANAYTNSLNGPDFKSIDVMFKSTGSTAAWMPSGIPDPSWIKGCVYVQNAIYDSPDFGNIIIYWNERAFIGYIANKSITWREFVKTNQLGSAATKNVVNNATTTADNTVLDGRMGKTLYDRITTVQTAWDVVAFDAGSMNVAANGNIVKSINVSKSGYSPIAINGFQSGSTHVAFCACYLANTATLSYELRNFTSEQRPCHPKFWIMYRKLV